MASGLRAPKATNAANRLAHDAKRVAWRVWAEGVVALRELDADDDALSEAVRRRWVTEVDDDARPGPVEPIGLPDDARAAVLVRWLRTLGRPATYPEAQQALGCSRHKIGTAAKAAGAAVAVKRGSSPTLTYVAPGDAPAAPTVGRITPEDRARQLAQLVAERPASRAEAARELGVSTRTVSLAAGVAVERGWITAGTGPGARYESRTP